jgi:Transglycosylase-like domain
VAEVDTFMAAIRQQESGGNYTAVNASSGDSGAYQFSVGTFDQALTLAGLGNSAYYGKLAADAPASVQDAAAKALMTQYYNQFGHSWFNVAEAWYGGPGAVGNPTEGGGPGYPDVGTYANQVMAIYNGLGGTTGVSVPTGIPVLPLPMTPQFAADIGFHYLNVIEPEWAVSSSYRDYTLSNLVTPPTALV